MDIFDIDSYLQDKPSNGTWYRQNTTGDIPAPRIDFCTVAISAPDNSSHHIYLYGGWNPLDNGTAFDDVYILSMPSFTWTAVFKNGGTPRYAHNCHIAAKRQMLTVGGNITSAQCDWEKKGVAVLDMTTITWGSVFRTNTTAFEVPDKVLSVTGGSSNGGATIKEPALGWNSPQLQEVWDTPRGTHRVISTPSPSSTPESSSNHTGAIAGGVVGGVAGLALVAGALFFLYRRRQKAKQPSELPDDEVARSPVEELPTAKKRFEMQGVNENEPAELPGPDPVELNAPREAVEAPRETATTATELPGTNIVAGGKHGVPIVRTPDDELPSPPLATPMSEAISPLGEHPPGR